MATILVVDDRAINREFLATLLGYVGHEVLQASDGVEALAIARAQRPTLIITDVLMPNMDGVELADRVHDDPDIAATPIIFYTATYRVPEASVLAESCRVSSVLAKPAEPQAILDAVSAALGVGPAPALMPQHASAPPSFLGARLPPYLRDLSELQQRLRRMVDEAVEEDGAERATDRDDTILSSYQTLGLRMAALLELGLVLPSERDPEKLLDLFCGGAQDIMNCKQAFVAVLDATSAASTVPPRAASPRRRVPGSLRSSPLPASSPKRSPTVSRVACGKRYRRSSRRYCGHRPLCCSCRCRCAPPRPCAAGSASPSASAATDSTRKTSSSA